MRSTMGWGRLRIELDGAGPAPRPLDVVLDAAAPPKGDLLVRRPLPAELVAGAEGAARAGQDDGANALSLSQRANAS